MENKITQLRKGILELAIMGCLHNESHYGYSLIRELTRDGDLNLTEGTIYPILSRLAKEGLVESEWRESSQGPPRKYYMLSSKGKKIFHILASEFERLSDLVLRSSSSSQKKEKKAEKKVISVKKERRDE